MTQSESEAFPTWFDVGDAAHVGDRINQQDFIAHAWLAPAEELPKGAPREGRLLIVVADGMGGHVGGDVASRECVTAFMQSVSRRQSEPAMEILLEGLKSANRRLNQCLAGKPELEGMGTTLVGVILEQQAKSKIACWHISVGDSLLLRCRAGKRELERLNAEHSAVAALARDVKGGVLTRSQAEKDPRRNQGHVLTSAVMGSAELDFEVDAPDTPTFLKPGDVIVVASDGLETLGDGDIEQCIREHTDKGAGNLATELVNAVLAESRPQQDNVSVVVAQVTRQKGLFG